ncbi:Hypothetical Protein FCC1311_031362 [Hondaea fermentalgiana]|uniref:Uncharacterized protein n=1 Tax=Hondaea fermentalgiana TaxID=2315210 RepID=A0A2R5GE59_9STRA|nr:Hypothetical Protein FCC1311_031362 [Hondaea fermentalgiana]|eukprot:GBG26913.1 Hypothetical Protein FCC1311_031362 [Hondaea fermentalgiana]
MKVELEKWNNDQEDKSIMESEIESDEDWVAMAPTQNEGEDYVDDETSNLSTQNKVDEVSKVDEMNNVDSRNEANDRHCQGAAEDGDADRDVDEEDEDDIDSAESDDEDRDFDEVDEVTSVATADGHDDVANDATQDNDANSRTPEQSLRDLKRFLSSLDKYMEKDKLMHVRLKNREAASSQSPTALVRKKWILELNGERVPPSIFDAHGVSFELIVQAFRCLAGNHGMWTGASIQQVLNDAIKKMRSPPKFRITEGKLDLAGGNTLSMSFYVKTSDVAARTLQGWATSKMAHEVVILNDGEEEHVTETSDRNRAASDVEDKREALRDGFTSDDTDGAMNNDNYRVGEDDVDDDEDEEAVDDDEEAVDDDDDDADGDYVGNDGGASTYRSSGQKVVKEKTIMVSNQKERKKRDAYLVEYTTAIGEEIPEGKNSELCTVSPPRNGGKGKSLYFKSKKDGASIKLYKNSQKISSGTLCGYITGAGSNPEEFREIWNAALEQSGIPLMIPSLERVFQNCGKTNEKTMITRFTVQRTAATTSQGGQRARARRSSTSVSFASPTSPATSPPATRSNPPRRQSLSSTAAQASLTKTSGLKRSYADLENELEKAKRQRSVSEERSRKLQSDLNAAQTKIAALEASLEKIKGELADSQQTGKLLKQLFNHNTKNL